MATLAQPPSGVSTGPHLDNRRVAAALIDLAVPAALVAVAYAAGLSFTRGVLLVALAWTLYYFFALESGGGQTLGKRVMKLRVVSADGSPASMEQIAKRTVVRILDGHIVGLIVMVATGERRQRLGDIVAGTVVTEATTAGEATVVTEPALRLAPTGPEKPAEPSVPWHKRSLKLPSRSKPSVGKTKRSVSLPSMSMPSLRRRRSAAGDGYSSQTSAPGPAAMNAAAMPAPMQARATPEVKPFEPFAEAPPETRERPEPYEAPEPYAEPEPEPIEAFMQREVVIEREPTVELDEPAYDTLDEAPEPEVELDRPEPEVELDRPEPEVELDRPEPEVELDRPEPEVELDAEHEHEGEDGAQEKLTIKPIETVSAIDLVMQDAEDRHPGSP